MDKVEMTTEQQLAFDDFIDVMVQIDFKFPIYYDGKEGRAIRLLNETTVETVVLMNEGIPLLKSRLSALCPCERMESAKEDV